MLLLVVTIQQAFTVPQSISKYFINGNGQCLFPIGTHDYVIRVKCKLIDSYVRMGRWQMKYSLSRKVINFTHSRMLHNSGRSWLLVARILTASKMLNKIANSTSAIPSTSYLPTATRLPKDLCNLKFSCEVHELQIGDISSQPSNQVNELAQYLTVTFFKPCQMGQYVCQDLSYRPGMPNIFFQNAEHDSKKTERAGHLKHVNEGCIH